MESFKSNFKFIIVYISLIFISIFIKFIFPNELNSYYVFIFLAFVSLLVTRLKKKIKLSIFFFIVLFLAGSHKEIQKKYFSFMSVMHWNDGAKVFSSIPFNFLKGNYKNDLNKIFKKDDGSNSGIIEIEEIFYLLESNNISEYTVSNGLQKKIDESTLFKQRLREVTYPSKIRNDFNNENYFKFYEISEKLSKNCNLVSKTENIKLAKC